MPGSRLETWQTPDGRDVVCPSRNEAAGLWAEIDEDGPFAAAVRDLRPRETVLDIGAHVGLSSLYVAGQHPATRILAFEPAPMLHACLSLNLARHAPAATALGFALGAEAGERILSYRPLLPAISTLVHDEADERRTMDAKFSLLGVDDQTGADIRRLQRVEEKVTVRVSTMRVALGEYAAGPVGLVKIDVERAELDVLTGVSDRCWPGIRQVVVDVHDIAGRLNHVVNLLRSKDYSVVVRQEGGFAGSSVHNVYARRDRPERQ